MTRWACCGAALVALLGALGPWPAASADDGWWSALDEGEAVSLADVVAKPEDYRNRTLTFFCIFHARESYFDPVRTPFNPKRYDNFSVWPDGAPVWEERAFRRDLPFLYIAREHPHRDGLMALPMVTRIVITGKVRAVSARGQPFIEVFSFRTTGHRLGRKVVRAINWGDNHARLGTRRGDQIAARSYRDALAPDLPPVYALIVRKRLAEALRRLGNVEEANLIERGEILGGGSVPAPEPGAAPPASQGMFGEPGALPPPVTPDGELPGTPPLATPPGELPGLRPEPDAPPPGYVPDVPVRPLTPDSELPGTPSGNPRRPDLLPPVSREPGVAAGRAPGWPGAPPPAPSPSAQGTGTESGLGPPPTGPLPALPPPAVSRSGEPPPSPAPALQPGATPPGVFPPPAPEPGAAAPVPQPPTRRPPRLPGVPPKRRPRLSGVK